MAVQTIPGEGFSVSEGMKIPDYIRESLATDKPQNGEPQYNFLVAEDEPGHIQLAAVIFNKDGHNVFSVEEGGLLVQAIRDGFKPDAIVTDLVMGGWYSGSMDTTETSLLNGDVAALKIKRLTASKEGKPTTTIPIILYTALPLNDSILSLLDSGVVDAIIRKPAKADEFLKTVKATMDRVKRANLVSQLS